MKYFKDTFVILAHVDKIIFILSMAGVSDPHTTAISDASLLVNARHIGCFTNKLQIKPDQPTAFNLFIGHEANSINFISDQTVRKLAKIGSEIKLCNIQSVKTKCFDWMMGSSPKMDTQHGQKSHNAVEKIKGYL